MLARNISLCIFLGLASISSLAATSPTTQNSQTVSRREVKLNELKQWYDLKKPMIVLDARTAQYFDGKVLPQAKWLPGDSSEAKITSTLPDKTSLIVVYCYSTGCPASGWLYDKLIPMGYTNVYEFHGGIVDWTKKGYQMVPQ
jgi:rhodanese-related sulfurtransferase